MDMLQALLENRFSLKIHRESKEVPVYTLTVSKAGASTANSSDPSLISTIKTAIKKLGLNLEPTEGPGEFIVIDHVERPSRNERAVVEQQN